MRKIFTFLLLVTAVFQTACCTLNANEETDCSKLERETIKTVAEIDLSKYFDGFNGCAVFYNPQKSEYLVYNKKLSAHQSSPCSTFKIVSSLIGLENGTITPSNPSLKWSGEKYWNDNWNRDTDFEHAFKTSCVWYFRKVIDISGKSAVAETLEKLNYGNRDISDWEGKLNTNETNPDLTGFWIESSLKISPWQQTDILYKIFTGKTGADKKNIDILKKAMLAEDKNRTKIYGKTGLGVKDGKRVDAWFVGMFEKNNNTTYFAVRLDDPDKKDVSSQKAKEIAINIINNNF